MDGIEERPGWLSEPADALAALATFEGPVLVDFDETLYLRNSTEDFLDTAWPMLPALLLLRLLDFLRPWRWSGGSVTRDIWRVRVIATVLPWTAWRWRRRVAQLAAQFSNDPLRAVLQARGASSIVATVGFEPIVAPLLAAMNLGGLKLVASRLSTFSDRRQGKLRMVQAALGDGVVPRALVLTDSLEDAPLLRTCALPIHTVWPMARYRRALSGVYLPGQYLSLVKRPGERYIRRGILQDDFPYWVLASVALADSPWLHVAGLLFLLLSFWTIYELGYVDNDRIAARFESQPKLTTAFHEAVVVTPRWQPWLWAAASGMVGIAMVQWSRGPGWGAALAWLAVLVAVHQFFRLYNRLDKSTRIWMYAALQFARAAAFAVVVPVEAIGAAALGAHVLARWVPYYVYRLSGGVWPDAKPQAMQLLFFVVLAALLAVGLGVSAIANWTTLALLGWMMYRARQDVLAIHAFAHRIDHAGTHGNK